MARTVATRTLDDMWCVHPRACVPKSAKGHGFLEAVSQLTETSWVLLRTYRTPSRIYEVSEFAP